MQLRLDRRVKREKGNALTRKIINLLATAGAYRRLVNVIDNNCNKKILDHT